MAGVCLTCGLSQDLEAHHVAGRRNHPLTVPVCLGCHRILTVWQLAAGIELRDSVAGTELDRTRALLVGAIHLVQLYAQRHAGVSWLPDWLAARTARAVSKLLDMCQPADRVGRWLPDPTVLPALAVQVPWDPSSEVERVAEMARVAEALARIVGGMPPLVVASVTAIAKDPAGWKAAVDRAVQDQSYATALVGLVSQYLDLSHVLMAKLFQLDDLDRISDELISEVAGWMDTVRALLDQLKVVAPNELAMPL